MLAMALDELVALLARHARPDLGTPIEGITAFRADHPNPPVPTTYGKVLAVVAQGAKAFALGERLFEYEAGEYMIASVDLPVAASFIRASPTEPALGFGFTLEPTAVAEVLLQVDPADLPPLPSRASAGLAVSSASVELLDAVVRLLRLLDRPADIPVLAPLIKREIIWRLLTGEQGSMLREFSLPDSNLSAIARSVHWIRENYAATFRVEELAQRVAMSVSAFHRNFQIVTSMSPIQYQKQIRLQRARLLIATTPGDIAAISRQVGYESHAQFSREYRRQFGRPPRQDAGRLVATDRTDQRSRAAVD